MSRFTVPGDAMRDGQTERMVVRAGGVTARIEEEGVMVDWKRVMLDYDKLEIGEPLPSYEYLLTAGMVEQYRKGVQDPDARFPTIAVKADIGAYHRKYEDAGSVNARCAYHCYNPPVAGRRIRVTAWIADKYVRRGKPYIVTEAISIDEDGRLIDRVITHELKRPWEVGRKWGQ